MAAAAFALGAWSQLALAAGEDEIEKVEDARYQAMIVGDWKGFSNMLADEFVYHQPSGKVSDKKTYVAFASSGEIAIKTAERYDVTIHVYGNTATAMGSTRLNVEMKGEPRKIDLRYLNVWVKRNGHWQLAARQSAFKQNP
jgi:ketosteroid isomerase-like protein